jgi:hypothetical protein
VAVASAIEGIICQGDVNAAGMAAFHEAGGVETAAGRLVAELRTMAGCVAVARCGCGGCGTLWLWLWWRWRGVFGIRRCAVSVRSE